MGTVIATLVGGLLALAGAWIGPHLQRKHDRWIAKREDQNLLRQKAQELFDELDRVIYESQKATLASVARLQDKTVEAVPVPDLGRVRAIAAIYFPSSLALIEGFEAQIQEVQQMVVDESQKALDAGEQGLDMLKALPMVMTTKYQQFAAKFVREMRSHLATNVPKFELVQNE